MQVLMFLSVITIFYMAGCGIWWIFALLTKRNALKPFLAGSAGFALLFVFSSLHRIMNVDLISSEKSKPIAQNTSEVFQNSQTSPARQDDTTQKGSVLYEALKGSSSNLKQLETKNLQHIDQVTTQSDFDNVLNTTKAIVSKAIPTLTTEPVIVTLDGKFAKSKSPPPFQIYYNLTDIEGCFDAKDKAFSIMKAIYSSPALQGKISRIKIVAAGQLRVSLGSADLGFDWEESGPSNFWLVSQKYNARENESGPINQRTYGVRINKSCE